jgi:phosphoribosylformylglycinamidine synthase
VRLGFPSGCRIVLLGRPAEQLSASELVPEGPFPWLDLQAERQLDDLLRALAARRLVGSAQDVSDGGLAVALAECCFASGVGAHMQPMTRAELFSEDQGRAVVTCCDEEVSDVLALAAEHNVPARPIGWSGGERLVVDDAIDAPLDELLRVWESGLL